MKYVFKNGFEILGGFGKIQSPKMVKQTCVRDLGAGGQKAWLDQRECFEHGGLP